MSKFGYLIISLAVGLFLGMLFQQQTDIKIFRNALDQYEIQRDTTIDTIYVSDTILDYVEIARYYPTAVKTDTIRIPIDTDKFKIHKVYTDTIDTVKMLYDSLTYRQSINYYIATTDYDIDTIHINSVEAIPSVTRYISTNNVTKLQQKKTKFVISGGIGIGIDTDGKIRPNIGLTVGVPLWQYKG